MNEKEKEEEISDNTINKTKEVKDKIIVKQNKGEESNDKLYFKESVSTLCTSNRFNEEINPQQSMNKEQNLEENQNNQIILSGFNSYKIPQSNDEKIPQSQRDNNFNPYSKDKNVNASKNFKNEINQINEENNDDEINNIHLLEDNNNSPKKESISLNPSSSNSTPLSFEIKEKKNFINLKNKSESQKESTLTKKYILNCLNDKDKTKMLQSMIMNDASDIIIDKIVKELMGSYSYVMKNKNGNYFLKDLIKVCKPSHRLMILKEIYKNISEDSCDKYGTHPIQALIDYSNSEEEYLLILYSFDDRNKTLVASFDNNASYVIQKIISHIPDKYKKKFNLIFVSFLYFIVNKKYGVVNVKFFVDNIKDDELLNRVIDLIRANFIEISTGQFGNYFIQHILEKWFNLKEGEKIKEMVISNFKELISNKYGSHICDLYLKLANLKEITYLMNYLNLDLNNNLNINDTDKVIMFRIMQKLKQKLVINQNNNNTSNYQNNNPRNINNYRNSNYNNNAINQNNNFYENLNPQNNNFNNNYNIGNNNYNNINNNFDVNMNNQNNINNNYEENMNNQNNVNNNFAGNMNNEDNINNNNFIFRNMRNQNNNFNNNYNIGNNNYSNINNNFAGNINTQNSNLNNNYNNRNNNFINNNNNLNNQFSNASQYPLSMSNFQNNNNDSNYNQRFPLSLNRIGNNNNYNK